jgi:hypothetical protein
MKVDKHNEAIDRRKSGYDCLPGKVTKYGSLIQPRLKVIYPIANRFEMANKVVSLLAIEEG